MKHENLVLSNELTKVELFDLYHATRLIKPNFYDSLLKITILAPVSSSYYFPCTNVH